MAERHTPVEVKRLDSRHVRFVWDSGEQIENSAAHLRRGCACAGCVHEMTGERLIDPADIPDDIEIDAIELVGAYALRFAFTDGHHTGIYPFDLLWRICPRETEATDAP